MWGIIPAAGAGSRIQPFAFSKELLPVGSRLDGETERPRAVSEYLVERMIAGGANENLLRDFARQIRHLGILRRTNVGAAEIAYVVQPNPAGFCDAFFAPFLSSSQTKRF